MASIYFAGVFTASEGTFISIQYFFNTLIDKRPALSVLFAFLSFDICYFLSKLTVAKRCDAMMTSECNERNRTTCHVIRWYNAMITFDVVL